MNSTALLFLNDFGVYVCAVMKTYITASDDALFLVIEHKQLKELGV